MLIKSSLINLIVLFLFVIHVITSLGNKTMIVAFLYLKESFFRYLEQCNSKETCSSCLSLSNQCAWCTQVRKCQENSI